jgi:hypothetical protein
MQQKICAISSVGRAIHLHWKGRGFESLIAHNQGFQNFPEKPSICWVFHFEISKKSGTPIKVQNCVLKLSQNMELGDYKRNLNIIISLHFLWYVVFFLCFPLMYVFGQLKIYILIFVSITLVTWLIWKACPLRIWENNLRRKYEPETVYEGNFTSHYLKQIFGLSVSVWTVRIVLWTLIGLLIYLCLS